MQPGLLFKFTDHNVLRNPSPYLWRSEIILDILKFSFVSFLFSSPGHQKLKHGHFLTFKGVVLFFITDTNGASRESFSKLHVSALNKIVLSPSV